MLISQPTQECYRRLPPLVQGDHLLVIQPSPCPCTRCPAVSGENCPPRGIILFLHYIADLSQQSGGHRQVCKYLMDSHTSPQDAPWLCHGLGLQCVVIVKPIYFNLLHVNPIIAKHSESINIRWKLFTRKPALSLFILLPEVTVTG